MEFTQIGADEFRVKKITFYSYFNSKAIMLIFIFSILRERYH